MEDSGILEVGGSEAVEFLLIEQLRKLFGEVGRFRVVRTRGDRNAEQQLRIATADESALTPKSPEAIPRSLVGKLESIHKERSSSSTLPARRGGPETPSGRRIRPSGRPKKRHPLPVRRHDGLLMTIASRPARRGR